VSHRCLEPNELVALLELPAADERRRAAAACPRCDALLRSALAFLAGDDTIPAAERAAAESRLAAATATLTGARTTVRRTRRRPAPARPALGARQWGWTAGLAAAAALVVLLTGIEPPGDVAPSGRLRGGSQPATAPLALVFTPAAGDSLTVTWLPVAGAKGYRLELYTADLDTLAIIDGLRGSPARVPAGALCRVRASAGSRELAASGLEAAPAR